MLALLKGLPLVGKLIATFAVLALLFGGYMTVKRFFTAGLKTEVKLQKENAKASIEAGAEAMNTVSQVETKAAETRQTVKEAQDEVAKAPDGDSNDAADRAVCRMRVHRDSERCARLRQVGAAVPARPDPGR
jgi:ribosomal protein S16